MAYTKTNWATAKISDANLNKMQQQYDEAIVDMWDARTNTAKEIRAYVVSSFPAHKAGLLIFHNGMKRFFMSNGSAWLVPPADALFGGGTGGDLDSTGNITISNAVGATVIADYSSFKLNENHTLTTQNPCRCLIIRSWGDIVIDGEINLDKKGGFPGRYITIGGVQYDLMGGNGGNGSDGGHGHISGGWGGSGGSVDANEDCAGGRRGGGGGGGGGILRRSGYLPWESLGGDGGPKNTCVNAGLDPVWGGEGGAPPPSSAQGGKDGDRGSGGGGAAILLPSVNYQAFGGRGGGSRDGGSGGGGGAGVCTSSSTADGENGSHGSGEYGGGALVLLAAGDIVINGQILARGGKGGDGGAGDVTGSVGTPGAGGGGGGGGQGGGRVIILRRGSYVLNGNIILTGGSGGTAGSPAGTGTEGWDGSAGASGTVQAVQI